MAHYEPSHLDLCCLQKRIMSAYGSERVKVRLIFFCVHVYNVSALLMSSSVTNMTMHRYALIDTMLAGCIQWKYQLNTMHALKHIFLWKRVPIIIMRTGNSKKYTEAKGYILFHCI